MNREVGRPLVWATCRIVSPKLLTWPLRRLTELRRLLDPTAYTDADPVSLRWVDPDSITYDLLPDRPTWPAWGRVVDGPWDLTDDRFADRPVPQSIRRHYRDGVPWDETPLSRHVDEQIDRFGDAWGHGGPSAFEHRVREIEALFDRMAEQGYLTQEALVHEDDVPGPPPVPVFGEIHVDIGHDGRLCWRCFGQHRLAIARLLEIDRVPVVIVRRHRSWQAVRDRVRVERAGGVIAKHRGHPDLEDLVSSPPDG